MRPIVVTPATPGEGAALVDALANAKTLSDIRAAAETVRSKRPKKA